MTADRVAKEIGALGQWLVATVAMFTRAHADGMAKHPNGFEPQASRASSDLPAIYHGFWDLSPGECLLIETPEPRGAYWGFQLSNGLWNTLDHANRQTSLNPAQAHADSDGMIRIVLAHSDPGVRNWLDTLGCYPLTGAIESEAGTLTAVIREMLLTTTSERQGRVIDRDSSGSTEKKKQEGYF